MTSRAIRSVVVAATALLVLVHAGSGAGGGPAEVNVQFSAYGPSQLDVLPGETVRWTNVSSRAHTVTSDTSLFNSGKLEGGARFSFTFADAGTYGYHCTIHPGIKGEIDVRRVILGPLPTAPVPVGSKVEFTGRSVAADRSIRIQVRGASGPFRTVGTATAAGDGSWRTTIPVTSTGDYRAISGTDVSQARRLLVGIRKVRIRATRTGVAVSVSPSAPYGRLLVELRLRERFGWWPVAHARLDYVSAAEIPVERPARVRVVLVDDDGWTPLATSAPVDLPPG